MSCSRIIGENEDVSTDFGIDENIAIDFEPTWSPDGKWIAYIHRPIESSDPDTAGIYLIRTDGTEKTLWLAERASAPDWSPEGNWIAYQQEKQIFKRNIKGDSLVQLTFANRNHFPSWSPDGDSIVFDSDRFANSTLFFIWKMDKDGNNKSIVASAPDEGSIRKPMWTVNNLILHTRHLKDVEGEEIFVMDSNGNNIRRLTYNNFIDRYPAYSSANSLLIHHRRFSCHPKFYGWWLSLNWATELQAGQRQHGTQLHIMNFALC